MALDMYSTLWLATLTCQGEHRTLHQMPEVNITTRACSRVQFPSCTRGLPIEKLLISNEDHKESDMDTSFSKGGKQNGGKVRRNSSPREGIHYPITIAKKAPHSLGRVI